MIYQVQGKALILTLQIYENSRDEKLPELQKIIGNLFKLIELDYRGTS